ncbi:MAG TPA: cation diffusion facilitator family transporter [bacterium]|nr:cation diffusion facilitator family transporter [bacterium]HPT29502.1 cation diffusion facilitator family transporter [bacterium]
MTDPKTAGLLPVLAAFLGNSIVCLSKFVGFAFSGSSALFSEAVHSLADTANQFLLLIGVKKSTKAADKFFPYGYGRERFVWALISACGIFFIGCGVTVYHGISVLIHQEVFTYHSFTIYILLASFIIESFTLFLAIRDIKKHSGGKKWRQTLKEADPVSLAVFYEDSLAVIGVSIAMGSIYLSRVTGLHFFDAAGSILIGLLLGIMAIVLINKNRSFLLSKAMPKELQKKAIEILESEPTIEKVLLFKSTVLDVNKYLIKCEVEFNASALIERLEKNRFLKKEYEFASENYEGFMRFCVDYMDRVPRLIGQEIDDIESDIKQQIPQILFIDIEIN